MPNKTLVSLTDFNKQKADIYRQNNNNGNGIACPNCGEELIDSKPNEIITTIPPKKSISCLNCDFTGTRFI